MKNKDYLFRLMYFCVKAFCSIAARMPLSERQRYHLSDLFCSRLYTPYFFSEYGRLYLRDKQFIKEYEKLADPFNFKSLDRKYFLSQLVKLSRLVDGDTAECGVYKGASSYFICKAIASTSKRHHTFDSFAGLSKPGLDDGEYWGKGMLSVSLDEVKNNLKDFTRIEYHPGWIPEKFHEVSKGKFSFVHIDVDLYQPTLDSCAFFYPRMSRGGILLIDDYGFSTCPGARKAVDEFFADKEEPVIDVPTGQCFIVKR